uniref:Src like adaptor 2 n=1 Tax=Terrapene triunguis TaxID=2587831 RepID=A0A674JZR4_9SAUR
LELPLGSGSGAAERPIRSSDTKCPGELCSYSTVGRGAWMAQEWGRLLPTPGAQCPVIAARWLYEGVSREKAEELLLLPCNRSGSFLIRESQTRQGCYSLSVRRTNHSSWDSIKHYRINRLENGWLYIAPRLTFPSLQELVDYYSGNSPGHSMGPTTHAPVRSVRPRARLDHI